MKEWGDDDSSSEKSGWIQKGFTVESQNVAAWSVSYTTMTLKDNTPPPPPRPLFAVLIASTEASENVTLLTLCCWCEQLTGISTRLNL